MEEPPVVGDWVRERNLGSGGFGVVTLWKNHKTNEHLAVKKCKWMQKEQLTEKQRERWSNEVSIMSTIASNHIVHAQPLPEPLLSALMKTNCAGLPILCMEYCSKGDLRQVLNRPENCSGLPESDVRNILHDISGAVSYLHNLKITHRDLKPENIVLQVVPNENVKSSQSLQPTNRKSRIVYKLIDLGYAKEIDSNSVCASFVGTMQYLAPELFTNKTYSNSVDFWSLGLVAFEIICGVRPFLPNMAPAQWINYVQAKFHQTICIYQDHIHKDSIVSQAEIYSEHNISHCLQGHFEKWFTIVLEYEPRKRGYISPAPKLVSTSSEVEKKSVTFSDDLENSLTNKGQLVIFDMLEEILEKKILNIFCVFTYEFLSYEIDQYTSVRTLLSWIERDTSVFVEDLVLIRPSQENFDVDFNGLACHCLTQEYDEPALYIFNNNKSIPPLKTDIQPKLPKLLHIMVSEKKHDLRPDSVKTLGANCLYFIKRENKLYYTLLKSLNSYSKYLLIRANECTDHSSMKSKLDMLASCESLLKSGVEFDCAKLKSLEEAGEIARGKLMNTWTESFMSIESKVRSVKEAVDKISVRLKSVSRRSAELRSCPIFNDRCDTELEDILEKMCKLFIEMRSHIRDKNVEPKVFTDKTLRICYQYLKVQDKKLRDQQLKSTFQLMVDIAIEINKIKTTISVAIENITKLTQEIHKLQQNRQNDIWSLINVIKSMNKNVQNNIHGAISTDLMKTTSRMSLNDATNDTADHSYTDSGNSFLGKPHFIVGIPAQDYWSSLGQYSDLGLSSSISGSNDFQSMIEDNLSLRYATQDLIKECFQIRKSVVSDDLDFSFLKEP